MKNELSTYVFNYYILIFSVIRQLSTLLNFGANLISLYFFPAKNS